MKNKITRILLIEDNPGDTRLVREALAEAGAARFDLVAKIDLASGLAALAAQHIDAILLDLTLPDTAGFETFTKVHEQAPQVPIIVLTGADDDLQAAKALREGAQDYLVKGRGNCELLLRSIRYAIQRKQSEEALHENEARYRNIFEGVEDAIFVETLSGQILEVNQRACEMYGYTREQFLTKTVADLVPSKEYSVLFNPDDPATAPGHPVETINLRSNGERFPIELSLRLHESQGEPVLFVVSRDITGRKQMEHVLQRSQEEIAHANLLLLALSKAAQAVQSAQTPNGVYMAIQEQMTQLGYEATVFERTHVGDELRIAYLNYASNLISKAEKLAGLSMRDYRFHPRQGTIYQRVLALAETVHEDNVSIAVADALPRKLHSMARPITDMIHLKPSTFAPMRVGDATIGILIITGADLTGTDNPAIAAFANQAAIALQNAQLYELAQQEISERKRTEELLQQSEERYKLMFESAPLAINITHGTQITYANPTYLQMFGYSTLDELKSLAPTEQFVPEYRPQILENIQRRSQGLPVPDHYEAECFKKDGTRFPILMYLTSTLFADGPAIVGFVMDISERKQAEEARLESELLLRALFELSPDSIMLMDPHTPDDSWPIIDCNLAACRINGFERDELIGNSIDMVNAFPADPIDRAAYRKRMRTEGSLHLEAFHRRKDGTVFPVEISTRLIQVGQRELVIGIDRDITGRKQVEAALRESEERFREIFENISSGVVVYEAVDGGNDFKFNHFNRAAEKIENIARDAVIGKTVCEVFPGVKEFGLFETLQRVWENGQPEHLPITLYTDQRMSGWRENYIARLPSGEILVVYDDVTERKQSEEALRTSEELFRSFIEQSSEGVILLDEQGCIIEWNHAQAQITGITAEQAIGTPFWEIQYQMLPPDRRSERNPEFFKQAMLEAFRTGKFPTSDKSIETQIYTPQGEAKFILQASFPIHSAKGYRVGSLVRDITERKRAELELQASHAAEKDFSERLSTLSEVTTELSKAGGLDESCRRAVELGRERLGLDRLSIWFISADHTTMQGTFGVDVAGRITDERHERFLIRPDFPVWSLVEGLVPLVHIPVESLYLDGQVIGQGEHVFAGLWDGNNVTGYISVDNLLSQRPFSDHDCEIIRLYASVVGRLISLKRAEATLRTSEENYRGAIAAAGLVPYGIDYETQRFTFMGDNILQLTGYSAEEITPSILKDCIQESHIWGLEATGITQEEAPRRFRSGEIKQWGNDLRITTRTGAERWLSDVSVPLPDKSGKVTSAIGIFQDLTGRKQAEQALQKSEARFRSIFENTAIGFYQTTPAGQIILANPAILHMLGYESFEDLSKRNLEDRDYQHEYPRTEFRRRIETDGEIKDLETAWVRADNATLYVRENARVVRDESGKVLYYEGTVEDITGRKQAEEKLREASSYNRRLIEASIDPLVTISPDGKITDVNEATEAVTGIARAQLIGDDFTNYFTEAAKARESFQKVLAEGLVRDYPLTIRHASGKTTDVLYNATVYKNEAGKIQGVFAAARDITERKLAEAALVKTERIYRQAITGAGGVPYQVDYANDRYVFQGEGFESLTGYLPSEMAGSELFASRIRQSEAYGEHKELPHEQRVQLSRLDGSLQEWREDYLFERKDGTLVWLSDHSVPVLDAAGNLIGSLGILMDITERKQAEELLKGSEAKYRSLYEDSLMGISQAAPDGHLLDVNMAYARMYGYASPDEMLSEVTDITQQLYAHPQDRMDVLRILDEKGFMEPRELLVNRRDGSQFFVVVGARAMRDSLGNLLYYQAMHVDITERKQAEEALRESENLLRESQISAGLGSYVLDITGGFWKSSHMLENIFGIDDSYNRSIEGWAALVHPDEQKMMTDYFANEVLSQGKPFDKEYRIIRQNDQSERWVHGLGRLEYDAQGQPLKMYGTIQDITERKQAEAALRESEERFRFIFENANDAIFIENSRDEFLSANQRACEILGYSLEEFQKMHVADIQAPEVRQPGSVVKNEMLQHKGSIFEGLDLHSSGRRIPVEISVGQIEQASGDLYVSIVRDITERKQAEAALSHQTEQLRQRNEELARLYRASSSLLSGASSNLQELAQTIIGIIQQEFGQANCSLFLIQRDSNELQRLAAAGPYTDQVKNKTLTLDGPGLVPQAIRTGQTVKVGNVHTVPDYVPNWESAMSEMAVPLKIGNDVIGIVDTQSALPDAFDKQDEDLMTIFAERAALALEHGRMYEQTEARVQQLAALRTVDMAISSSFDIHLTLDILLDQVRAQLGVHAADILEYNQVTQTFSFSCGQGFRTHALQHTHLRLGEGYAGKAAMERRLLKVPDLHAEPSGFGRSPLLVGENFLSYVGVPLIAKGQIKGVLEIFNREPFDLSSEQQSFLEILAGQAGIAMDNAELYEHQQRSIADLTIAYNDTLEGWASALELRDKETEGHTRRVTNLTIRLARALGVNENDQVQIYRGALLHDIGKIGVPDAIVLKPGPLTDEEWVIMRQHPLYAYNMLSPIGYLREALIVPYCHHEKWDGTGYPRGLKAEEIPLAARIFSVVDVWDALTSDRPYRKAWTHEKARLYMTEQSGTQFEPRVVETFFREVLTQ